MSSNQNTQQYTGFQLQQAPITVPQFKVPESNTVLGDSLIRLGGQVAKHFEGVERAEKNIDATVALSKIKGVEDELSALSQTLDEQGNVTLADGTHRPYTEVTAEYYDRMQSHVMAYQDKYKHGIFTTPTEADMKIGTMQALLPQSLEQTNTKLAMQHGNLRVSKAIDSLVADESMPLQERVTTISSSIQSLVLPPEAKDQLEKQKIGTVFAQANTRLELERQQQLEQAIEVANGDIFKQRQLEHQVLEAYYIKKQGLADSIEGLKVSHPDVYTAVKLDEQQGYIKAQSLINANEQDQAELGYKLRVNAMQSQLETALNYATSSWFNPDAVAFGGVRKQLETLYNDKSLDPLAHQQVNEALNQFKQMEQAHRLIKSKGVLGVQSKEVTPALQPSLYQAQQEELKRIDDEQNKAYKEQFSLQQTVASTEATGVLTESDINRLIKSGVDPQAYAEQRKLLTVPLNQWLNQIKINANAQGTDKVQYGMQLIAKYDLVNNPNKFSSFGLSGLSELTGAKPEAVAYAFQHMPIEPALRVLVLGTNQATNYLKAEPKESERLVKEFSTATAANKYDRTFPIEQQIAMNLAYTFQKNPSLLSGDKIDHGKIRQAFRETVDQGLAMQRQDRTKKLNMVSNQLQQRQPLPVVKGVTYATMTLGNPKSQPVPYGVAIQQIGQHVSKMGATVTVTSAYRDKATSIHSHHSNPNEIAFDFSSYGGTGTVGKKLFGVVAGMTQVVNSPRGLLITGHNDPMLKLAQGIKQGKVNALTLMNQHGLALIDANRLVQAVRQSRVTDEGAKAQTHLHVSVPVNKQKLAGLL
jgi:hypothetical protein